MPLTYSYRLRPEVEIDQGSGGLWLHCPYSGNLAGWSSNRPLPLLAALTQDWLDQEEMAARFAPGPADPASPSFQLFLLRLIAAGLLDLRVLAGGELAFSVSPAPDEDHLRWRMDLGCATLRLNRFAYLRAQDGGLLLESPLTPHRVWLGRASLLALLSDLASGGETRPAGEGEAALLALMLNLGLAEPDAEPGADDPMAYWEFHDMLFHARSLAGRDFHPSGGTYRFSGSRPSLPVAKQAAAPEAMELPRPRAEMAARLESPLVRVLEARRSRRDFDPRPLSLEELGAFLHASARVQTVMRPHQHDEELSLRPYPSGGARHALEIYPVVRRCQGLAVGAYHYDPLRHALEPIASEPKALTELLADNPHHLEGPQPPQVDFYLAARLGRVAWKYQAIAYKVINQDLGGLYQTFYLVGTALGLAPCAIGNLDAPRAGKTLGLDWRDEPLVGRFTLGCPPAPVPATGSKAP